MKRECCISRVNPGVVLAIGALAVGVTAAQAQVLYYSSFPGSGGLLNGLSFEAGTAAPATWSANSAFLDNGSINGTVEGSAVLPFNPVANQQYVLSLDVFNTTDRWIALGFARDPLANPGSDQVNDRFSNEAEGISWMLFRQHATDATQNIQIFGGLRTANGITDDNRAIDFNAGHELKILLDTTGDGTRFTANFFLDETSLLPDGAPVTVARSLEDINFVGMSFDDSTTATTITFDNFTLAQVPEPGPALLLFGGLALLGWHRCRKSSLV